MATHFNNPKNSQPLTPAVFHILLALVDEDRHGYGIMKDVEFRTEGRVLLKPGTLYQAIKRLLEAGLIEAADEKIDADLNDERRRYYHLTGLGQNVLNEEVLRLKQMIQLARTKHVLGAGKVAFSVGT